MRFRSLAFGRRGDEAGDQTRAASLRRMTSNVASQVFSLAASAIDRLVLVGVLLRAWGPDMFADYSVIQSAATMLTIVELGLQLYFQNVEKAAYVAGDRPAFRRFAGVHLGLILAIFALAVAATGVFVALGGAGRLLHLRSLDAATGRDIFVVYALGSLLTVVRSTTTTIYTAVGDFAYVVAMTAVFLAATTFASLAAVLLGGGPLVLAALYCAINGAGSLAFFLWDTRRRYPDWVARPATPNLRELSEAGVHLKWFSLQTFAPTLWLQTPILVFNAWHVGGASIASFLLIRTMVNLIRQTFQFASIGAGLEIATLYHRGDHGGAWRQSARIGLLTTVLSAAAVAAILTFGEMITFYWTGAATLYSPSIALWMLIPLLAVAPLQQPFALLQYANLTLAPGLQRLLQIVAGPIFCIVGQALYGPLGVVIGLALAEILAAWSLLPLLRRMAALTGFDRYCVNMLAAAAAALALCLIDGFVLMRLFPSNSGPAMIGKLVVWTLTAAVPAVAAALPERLRGALMSRLRRRAAPARDEVGD